MDKATIHIGQLIHSKLKEEGRTASWLAQRLNCDRTNVYKIFYKQSIDIAQLLHISTILNFDFFSCYSELMRKGGREKHEKKVAASP